jgi:hypothetical protein
METHDVYIVWNADFVHATHDGYCSGDESEEVYTKGKIYVTHSISEINYKCLLSIIHHKEFLSIIGKSMAFDNQLEYRKFLSCPGSGYCGDSREYNLNHELLILLKSPLNITFIEPSDIYLIDYLFDDLEDSSKIDDKFMLDAELTKIRNSMKMTITTILCLKQMGINKDICRMVGKTVSTTELFPNFNYC